MNDLDKMFEERRKRIGRVRVWIDVAIIGLLCSVAAVAALITWLTMRFVA